MKKFIKNNLKVFVAFIIGGVVFGTTVYAAYKYQASDVEYTPGNENFDVDNVSDAIKELYKKTTEMSGATYVSPKSGETHKGIIYLDPTNLDNTCDENNSVSTTGRKTGCMKWYIYSEGDKSYALILDHNTTATQQWYESDTNVAYENSLVKPVVDKLVSESGWKVTPRLITVEEVNTITGKTGFDVSNNGSWYYFDSKYGWLIDYTNCSGNGCNVADNTVHGYWTSTTIGSAGDGSKIWDVCENRSVNEHVASVSIYGVRPVITISKSIIKG